MALSPCSTCKRVFSGMTAFDKHLPPIVDGPKQDPCLDPVSVGLEHRPYTAEADHWIQEAARRTGVWGLPWDATEVFGKPSGNSTTVKPERVLAGPRPCATCGLLMAKRPGRGRFPKNCAGCGGTGTLVEHQPTKG